MKINQQISWLVGGALIAGFFLGGAVARDATVFGPTVASWVQAVGSVVAIVASAAIALLIDQNAAARLRVEREALDDERRKAERRVEISAYNHALDTARLASFSISVASAALKAASGGAPVLALMMLERRVEGSVRQFDHIDMTLIHDLVAISEIVHIRMLAQSAADQIAAIYKPVDGLPNNDTNMRARQAAVEANLDELFGHSNEVGKRLNLAVARALSLPPETAQAA